MENHCVICYKVIPEGRMVCPECERAVMRDVRREGCGEFAETLQSGREKQCRHDTALGRAMSWLAIRLGVARRKMHT